MGEYLTRDDILAADDIETEEVPVPEWGGTVRVRSLAGDERDALEESATKNGKLTLANFTAKLVAASIVDADGNRLFSQADVARLGRKSARALNRVMETAKRLSRFDQKDVEELVGNSVPGQPDASRSGWPGTSG